MNFTQLKSTLEGMKVNQANYQPVVMRALLKSPSLAMGKDDLKEELVKYNTKKDFAYFCSCPVWEVLTGKKAVKFNAKDRVYSINANLSKAQREELLKIVNAKLKDAQ